MKDKQTKDKVDYDGYWKKFAEETGEEVRARSMGQWRDSTGRELWGLLILTNRSFRFRYMPGKAWFTAIVPAARPRAGDEEPLEIVVPRADIKVFESPRRGFFERLFGPPWPSFRLSWREGDADRSETFMVNDSTKFLAAMDEALKAKGFSAEAGT
jgi:hypothetical protein